MLQPIKIRIQHAIVSTGNQTVAQHIDALSSGNVTLLCLNLSSNYCNTSLKVL